MVSVLKAQERDGIEECAHAGGGTARGRTSRQGAPRTKETKETMEMTKMVANVIYDDMRYLY